MPSATNQLNIIKRPKPVVDALELSIVSPERLLNLDDPSKGLELKIKNAIGATASYINVELPQGWKNDVPVDVPSECQPLVGGATCSVTVKAMNGKAIHLPGYLKIREANNANNLLDIKLATMKGGGVIFNVQGNKIQVIYPRPQDIPRSYWQQANKADIDTTIDDGATNTANIMDKIMDSQSTAGICKNLNFGPSEADDSRWYLPAICELGYNLAGGPGGCADTGYGDFTSLVDVNGVSLPQGEYLSSSESIPGSQAYVQNFTNNTQSTENEDLSIQYRCIRSFSY